MTTPYELRPPNEPRRPQGHTHSRRFAVSVTLLYAISVLVIAGFLGLRMHDWARQRIVQSSILATIGTPIVTAADAVATEMAAPDLSGSAASQPQSAAPVVTPEPTPSFTNILLLGSDERPDETGPSRTDTMILLSINPQDKTLGMLSMPRDLWVPIPGQNITTKINTAYGIGEAQGYAGGGAQLAKDTVSSLIGRPVDYFVRVNFDGFRELIDLIGGVDVVVASTIHDEEYPTADYGVETFHLDAGPQHLDGATALKYARTRHTDDDYNRARRQQEIIRAVADKVLSANMIPQLLPRVPQLLMTMQNSIETDIPIPVGLDLANLVSGSTLREVRQLVLDSQYGEGNLQQRRRVDSVAGSRPRARCPRPLLWHGLRHGHGCRQRRRAAHRGAQRHDAARRRRQHRAEARRPGLARGLHRRRRPQGLSANDHHQLRGAARPGPKAEQRPGAERCRVHLQWFGPHFAHRHPHRGRAGLAGTIASPARRRPSDLIPTQYGLPSSVRRRAPAQCRFDSPG
jgi:LCP family protein required for cell wall assembly